MANSLIVVHVSVRVKPEMLDAFRAATLLNARASVQEPGCARFDVMQDPVTPTSFLLVEIFRSLEAQHAHRATEHYKAWRETVESMMAAPRSAQTYASVFPEAL